MRKLRLAFTLLVVAACTSPQVTSSPSPPAGAPAAIPSATSAISGTATPASSPTAALASAPNLELSIGPGVSAEDFADVREGTAIVSRYIATVLGGDRSRPAVARIRVGTGTEEHCCFASPGGFDIVTSQHFWTTPSAPSPETWTVNTERKELAAHEYVHVWQHELGTAGCVRGGPRWIVEGMAEWIAYHSLIDAGLIGDGRIDVFIERQLRQARYLPLSALVRSFPFDAEPYAVSYFAVDLLVQSNGALALRTWCEQVGSGEAWTSAFRSVFGESITDFYNGHEAHRADYDR